MVVSSVSVLFAQHITDTEAAGKTETPRGNDIKSLEQNVFSLVTGPEKKQLNKTERFQTITPAKQHNAIFGSMLNTPTKKQ